MSRIKEFFKNARITQGALILLLLELGASMVFWFSNDAAKLTIFDYGFATGETTWAKLHVWTLATSPFLLTTREWLTIIFHGLIMWMFLPVLENWWGTKRFLRFAAITLFVTTLFGSLSGYLMGAPQSGLPINGLDGFIYACIVAYGILYKDRDVYFFAVLPLKGRQLMYGFIAFVALFIILQQYWARGIGYAASMITAWLIVSGRWNPRLWMLKRKQKRVKRKLSVMQGGKKGKPTMLN